MKAELKLALSISGYDFLTLCQACKADGRMIGSVEIIGTARYLPTVHPARVADDLFYIQQKCVVKLPLNNSPRLPQHMRITPAQIASHNM